MRMVSRYVSLTVVPLALGLAANARPALTLFVGYTYIEGAGPLVILAGTFAFTVFGMGLAPMLLALGETPKASTISIVSVVISVVVGFALLPFWGMIGAAVARALAMILSTALGLLILGRVVRLELDLEAIWKSLVAGSVMAVVVLAAEIPMQSGCLLPLYAMIGALTYVAMLRILRAIKPSDMEFFRQYLGPRFESLLDPLERCLIEKRNYS